MKGELYEIMNGELNTVQELVEALDVQYECVVHNDVAGMQKAVDELEKVSKSLAAWEMKRRSMSHGKNMNDLVEELGDEALVEKFRSLRKKLNEAMLQKETNDALIKQRLGFATKMLTMMNPDRTVKTYNSYGKRR